jgi:hypothetical protein
VIDVNPFNLSGPEFLFFYIGFAALVIIESVFLRRKYESGSPPRIDLSDPLLIAFLRGGHSEAMRVATVSLVDRGLLLCVATRLETAPHARPESVRRPIERAILEKFVSSGDADSMFADSKLKSALGQLDSSYSPPVSSEKEKASIRNEVAGITSGGELPAPELPPSFSVGPLFEFYRDPVGTFPRPCATSSITVLNASS